MPLENHSFQELSEAFSYHPDTGIVTWKVSPNFRIKIGDVAGCLDKQGYYRVGFKKKVYLLHRLAWFLTTGVWPKELLDHKDCDTTNNKFDNLREATKQENLRNGSIKTNSVSGYKGVSRHSSANRWVAQGVKGNKKFYLGLFVEAEEAAKAYDTFAKEHYGEFAHLNFKEAV